jgi:4'-phosphopantetheinyl transferase
MIDLWLEDLTLSDADYAHYWQLLDANEQAKASRFFQQKHRDYYVSSHGKLRTILASYANIPPEQLCFAVEAFGKPYLVIDGSTSKVTFNLSHSDNKMLLAVGHEQEIGIDIEGWNNRVDCTLIANACFAESERLFWQSLPQPKKDAAFYQFWTRKESFVKAVGAGITIGVADIISTINGEAGFLSIPTAYGVANDWQVVDLSVGQGFSAALSVKNTAIDWQWRTQN